MLVRSKDVTLPAEFWGTGDLPSPPSTFSRSQGPKAKWLQASIRTNWPDSCSWHARARLNYTFELPGSSRVFTVLRHQIKAAAKEKGAGETCQARVHLQAKRQYRRLWGLQLLTVLECLRVSPSESAWARSCTSAAEAAKLASRTQVSVTEIGLRPEQSEESDCSKAARSKRTT